MKLPLRLYSHSFIILDDEGMEICNMMCSWPRETAEQIIYCVNHVWRCEQNITELHDSIYDLFDKNDQLIQKDPDKLGRSILKILDRFTPVCPNPDGN